MELMREELSKLNFLVRVPVEVVQHLIQPIMVHSAHLTLFSPGHNFLAYMKGIVCILYVFAFCLLYAA